MLKWLYWKYVHIFYDSNNFNISEKNNKCKQMIDNTS